ncbi:MAG: ATP-binding protein [Brevundimonas sp.]|uniref:ATP-binding protein n=1 Tax=Brevundimonas sp. TaxID=1871086 RepID=UPI00403381DD
MPLSRAMHPGDLDVTAPVAPTRAPRATPRTAPNVFSQPLIPIGTAIAVTVLTLMAARFGHTGNHAAVLWLANAVATGMWLRTGRGLAFDLPFGGLMACGLAAGMLLSGYDPLDAAMLVLANLAEIVAGVLLVRRLAPGLRIISVRTGVRVLAALMTASAVSALAGAVGLQMVFSTPLTSGVQLWMFGHALGLAIVTPLILSIDGKMLADLRRPLRAAEAVVMLGGVAALAYALSFEFSAPLAFLMNPLILVVAIRLRVVGVTIAMLTVTLFMLGSLIYSAGPPATIGLPMATRVLMAQLHLAFAYVPYLLVATLIEERGRLWAQARAGLARAERASEAKSRLLANVAHEIKSPVAGVIGIGELWSSGQLGPVNATQTEMAGMLVKTARQVETLAHDLLDVARAEAGTVKVEARPTEIVSLVEDVRRTALLRPEAKGVAITIDAETPSQVALVDSQRLGQVIDNLAVNALKYGASGGRVEFRVKSCALGVRIEVADAGPGLSPAKQAQLFEPFNRLGLERSTIEGHGVGLALARRLVELQGGEIGVISAEGEGATFWVEVPAA